MAVKNFSSIDEAARSQGGTQSENRKSLASMQKSNKDAKQALKDAKALQKAEKKGAEEIEKFKQKQQQKRAKDDLKASKQEIKERDRADLVARAAERKAMQDNLKKEKEEKKIAAKEAALETLEGTATAGEKLIAGAKLAGMALADAASAAVSKIGGALMGSVDQYMDTYIEYMGAIEARIQGAYANVGYEELEKVIRQNTAGSPFIRYDKALENLAQLVDAGTAVNLTQRAFLATISEKIATTFDVFDSNLLRMIRIQQTDTTAARLGMEAELTQLFNYYFSDTSYLSESFDSVTAALTDLSAQLGAIASVETEYIIQKWLGALGSVGVDDSTLTNIASAINALGTGQIDYLTSNTEMQNLLVMAANRMGLSYSDMLVNGISSADANKLLYGIIDYIQEVTSGVNNVVKSQYAQLFGLTMTDIVAFENISDSVINTLYASAMSYNNTLTELNYQLSQVSDRMHLSEKIDNIIENVLMSTGVGVASSAALYGTYKAADMVQSITGGIYIPTISVFGSSITLPNAIEEYVKMGIVGISTMGSLFSAIGNWANGGGLSMSRWTSSWDKGSFTGFTSMDQLTTTTSSTGVVSNTNETGMQQSTYDEQQDSAEEISGQEQQGEEDSQMVKLLTRLVEFFEESKSAKNPLFVQLFTPTNAAATEDLSITGLLRVIRDRLNIMGTDEEPIYTVDDTLVGKVTSDWSKNLLPGQTMGGR